MSWWQRQPRPEPLAWRSTDERVRLATPQFAGRALVATSTVSIDGRQVLSGAAEGALPANPGEQQLAPTLRPLVTKLARSLPQLGVTDDFFAPVARLVPAPVVELANAPVDDDPYDGRHWRVHTAHPGFAEALFTSDLWDVLVALATEARVVGWIDHGYLALAPAPRRDVTARQLVRLAQAVDDRISSGALDAWLDCVAPIPPAVASFHGSGWSVSQPGRALVLELWRLWPGANFGRQVSGCHHGTDFLALESLTGLGRALVLVRLDKPVPDHVHVARQPHLERGNIHTEWLDFDDDFEVRASDPAVGHAVTSPRLMEYLYDKRIHGLDVAGNWIMARARRFHPDDIGPVVEVLAGARELLPRHEL